MSCKGLELATAAVTEGQLDVLKHPLLETMLALHDMFAGRSFQFHRVDNFMITCIGLELATAAVTEGQLDVLKYSLLETMLTLHDMYAGKSF